MHRLDGIHAGRRRLGDLEALVVRQRGADRLGSAGVFERRLQAGRLDLVLRVVLAMTVRREDPDHASSSSSSR